jgi:hypothetical protein
MAVMPTLNEQETRAKIADAIPEACVKHADFADQVEGMAIAALAFLPYPPRVTGPEYVEMLYTVAKHCGFMEPVRWRVLMNQKLIGGVQ